MTEKRASDYTPEKTDRVRSTCLYLATVLGDAMERAMVIGGMVPTLIVNQETAEIAPHVGTTDLDLGLSLGLFDGQGYKTLTGRLRSAGFEPERNPGGNASLHRWVPVDAPHVAVDFLMPPSPGDEPGRVTLVASSC